MEELWGVLRLCRRWRAGVTSPRASSPTSPSLSWLLAVFAGATMPKTRVRVSLYYCGKRKSWDEGKRRGLQRDCCCCCWGGCLHGRSCSCLSIQACPSPLRRKSLQIDPCPLPVLGRRESRQLPTLAAWTDMEREAHLALIW